MLFSARRSLHRLCTGFPPSCAQLRRFMRDKKRANEFAPTKSANGPSARFSEGDGFRRAGFIRPRRYATRRAGFVGPDLSGRGVTRYGVRGSYGRIYPAAALRNRVRGQGDALILLGASPDCRQLRIYLNSSPAHESYAGAGPARELSRNINQVLEWVSLQRKSTRRVRVVLVRRRAGA